MKHLNNNNDKTPYRIVACIFLAFLYFLCSYYGKWIGLDISIAFHSFKLKKKKNYIAKQNEYMLHLQSYKEQTVFI